MSLAPFSPGHPFDMRERDPRRKKLIDFRRRKGKRRPWADWGSIDIYGWPPKFRDHRRRGNPLKSNKSTVHKRDWA